MALIEKFVVVANHYEVAAGQEIIEGNFVKMNSSGEIVIANGSEDERALGVAGDTKSTSVSGLPTTNDATIGSDGASTSSFVNRVSDSFDQTKASGRITVYENGGTFATNLYEETGIAAGDDLYISANGKLTKTPVAPTSAVVAVCTKAPGAYDSGVPGVDVNGSMSLGSYLEFKMLI